MDNFCPYFDMIHFIPFQIIPFKDFEYNFFEKIIKCADITAFTRNIKKVHFICIVIEKERE